MTASPTLRLIPTVDTAEYAGGWYLFDRAAEVNGVVSVPTQRVSARTAAVVRAIKAAWPGHEPRPPEAFAALFDDDADRSALRRLAEAGYLEPVLDATGDAANAARWAAGAADGATADADADAEAARSIGAELDAFRQRTLKHFFRGRSFFHLPERVEDAACAVALVGVPVSSVQLSGGTVAGPGALRQVSQRAGFWFDIHDRGVYSETACDGGLPRLIGKGVVVKDFGDLGQEARTVGELFSGLGTFIEERLLPSRIRPVFVGGDHAITFPIVDCYLRHYPDLVLLHLDAHNDLLYTERVEYNHAGPVQGLLLHSNLGKVLSFGLRTSGDPRVDRLQQLRRAARLDQRAHFYSLGATRRWLQDPAAWLDHLAGLIGEGSPCYLTIDLDVLSAEAIAGQLSTPAGDGLRWDELLEMVVRLTAQFDVVACDVVEFNPLRKDRPNGHEREPAVLLLELIEGLAAAGRRAAARLPAPAPTPAAPSRAAGGAVGARTATPRGGGFARPLPIDRRDARTLDYGEFLREYALPGRPVILTGLDQDWQQAMAWTPASLAAAAAPGDEAEVRLFDDGGSAGRVARREVRDVLVDLAARWDQALPLAAPRTYLVNWQFADHAPALCDALRPPRYFSSALNHHLAARAGPLTWMFVGEPDTGSPTHTDILNTSAWLVLLHGRKRWRMVMAPDLAACGRIGAWVDLFAPDHERHPGLDGITLFEGEQEPGEVVFTPPLCLHAVWNRTHTIAITQNVLDLTNLVHVHDALAGGLQPAPPAAGWLAQLTREGLDDLRARGLVAQARPALDALREDMVRRRSAASARQLECEAVLRELDRT